MRCLAFIAVLIPFASPLWAEKLSLSVHADSAILMNADTGAILYEKNSRKLQYPASTTKIATAIYALKTKGDNLNVMITADQDAIGSISDQALKKSNYTKPAYWLQEGSSHMGIKRGEELSYRDLLYGLMVASADDAANVIAQHVGGTIPNFIKGMNEYVQKLGAKDTLFMNPHGLHHPKHQSTAYDLAIITIEAMKDPFFRELVSTIRYTRPKTNKQESTILLQTNRLIKKGTYYYPKAIGVKTGYYSLARHNLVAAAKDGDRTLIAVLLKSPERSDVFTDAIKMFEAAFSQPKVERVILKGGRQKFVLDLPKAAKPLQTYLPRDITLTYYPAEEPTVKCLLFWDTLTPPIKKDQRVGELRLTLPDNSILRIEPIYAFEDVPKVWLGGIFTLNAGMGWFLKLAAVLGVIFLLGALWLRRSSR